jgi:hypothetical protein
MIANRDEEILTNADEALSASVEAKGPDRLWSMIIFMECVARFASEVASGRASWDTARSWALSRTDKLWAARNAMDEWQNELARYLRDRGEEGAERALEWRSQYAFVQELFRDTDAEEFLAAYDYSEADQEMHDLAEQLALDAPDYVPRTHTWWRWRDDG